MYILIGIGVIGLLLFFMVKSNNEESGMKLTPASTSNLEIGIRNVYISNNIKAYIKKHENLELKKLVFLRLKSNYSLIMNLVCQGRLDEHDSIEEILSNFYIDKHKLELSGKISATFRNCIEAMRSDFQIMSDIVKIIDEKKPPLGVDSDTFHEKLLMKNKVFMALYQQYNSDRYFKAVFDKFIAGLLK